MAAPLGNQNAVRGKIFRSVIAKRLEERRALEAIVDKAIEQASEGDDKARAWLADRMDGKAVQSVDVDANITNHEKAIDQLG
jgi:hypothetical protein